jgi:hypothetical protein
MRLANWHATRVLAARQPLILNLPRTTVRASANSRTGLGGNRANVSGRGTDLHVPSRDAQVIFGHARISKTLEIYTNAGDEAQRDAFTRLHGLLDDAQD